MRAQEAHLLRGAPLHLRPLHQRASSPAAGKVLSLRALCRPTAQRLRVPLRRPPVAGGPPDAQTRPMLTLGCARSATSPLGIAAFPGVVALGLGGALWRGSARRWPVCCRETTSASRSAGSGQVQVSGPHRPSQPQTPAMATTQDLEPEVAAAEEEIGVAEDAPVVSPRQCRTLDRPICACPHTPAAAARPALGAPTGTTCREHSALGEAPQGAEAHAAQRVAARPASGSSAGRDCGKRLERAQLRALAARAAADVGCTRPVLGVGRAALAAPSRWLQ